ncbi:FAD linked oxidase, N-terminal [Penicillium expansum]|uniref:FAD linked oxidase, N-terminal n=1 Tax=Penicillium expansum TaxID=27334 RepID=A0A0A2IUS7_PENEN|nr:FAD linked oxidase, N-terminal [Penicillium expansum]KGO46867.1 FAD linked oxidase, N-terminal [Penicillium expansum]KGO62365.1 FAD linked oxidase, N-terminal [Penicillium expansum]
MPQDPCWPEDHRWAQFNRTVNGNLIATVPIASFCHVDSFTPYDQSQCVQLQSNWGFPETHYESPSSIMASVFTNLSCNPFSSKSSPCSIGNYVQYTVNATDAADVQETINFAARNNIRLVIRNTGHDLLGKSTGAGGLAIWMHYMKDIAIVDYASSDYSGKAMKMGAGVQSFEANQAAYKAGLIIVGGNCPTVGLAGGYSQGGGHGQLVSHVGLAADQVLEWEVVLANGSLVTASPTEYPDLYWALSGGGGGTYGVVVSMTSKAYPELPTVSGNLSFSDTGVSRDTFFAAVTMFISILPSIGDAGGASVWWLTNTTFSTTPTTIPGGTATLFNSLLSTLIAFLEQNDIQHTYYVNDFPTYSDAYQAMNPPSNITDQLAGGRLVPRSVVEQNLANLTTVFRNIVEKNAGFLISGVMVNSSRVAYPENSVNRAWREALMDVVIGALFDYNDWGSDVAHQQLITDVLMPPLEELTPGSGAYLNEADPNQKDWQQVFYGDNYDNLLAIKRKYDPHNTFYAFKAVGSEAWTVAENGRLCKS